MTNVIRDMWNSMLVKGALEICRDGGMTNEQGVELCTGKLKLEGDTRKGDHTLEVMPDDAETHFTIERQIEQLEDKFIFYTDQASFLNRQMKLGTLPTARAASYRINCIGHSQMQQDDRILKDVSAKAKNIIEGLTLLYPMIGKSIADIPVEKLGTIFSAPEQETWDSAWEAVHQRVFNEASGRHMTLEAPPKKKKVLVRDNDKFFSFANGWISPPGDFYGCGWMGHISLGDDLADNGLIAEERDPTKKMEELGWMKLQDNRFIIIAREPTQSQIDMILEYSEKNNPGKIYFNFEEFTDSEDFFEELEERKIL